MSLRNLQSCYDSSESSSEASDSEEVVEKSMLVRSKDAGGNEDAIPAKRPRILLPVPSSITNMFGGGDANNRASSNQGDEQENGKDGRVRSFPHVRGNWASFVHISLNQTEIISRQLELFKKLKPETFSINDDFHVSLSRTQVFCHHWIDSFIQSIKQKVSQIHRFAIIFEKFEVYVNDEKTRTFIGIKIHPSIQLLELVKSCDDSLAEFELEPFYEDPSFHISLAWAVGDQLTQISKDVLPKLNAKWYKAVEQDSDLQSFVVKSVAFKTGNKFSIFPLKGSD